MKNENMKKINLSSGLERPHVSMVKSPSGTGEEKTTARRIKFHQKKNPVSPDVINFGKICLSEITHLI